MKKKVLALILSITACLGVATGYNPYVSAESTAEEVINGENGILEYAQYSDHIEITGFTSIPESRSVDIPETINDLPVTRLCNFVELKAIETITLPDTITSIDSSAFMYARVSSIVIPKGITKIEHGTFEQAGLNSVVFNENLKEIGSFAFDWCPLIELNLPDGIEKIGNNAFSNTHIESIVIPESVTYLSPSAFIGCYNLKFITLPENLIEVYSYSSFKSCFNEDKVVLKGYKDSKCFDFAKENGIKFMYIDDGIEYMLGDYDGNTEIDAADASAILTTFSLLQTGNENKLTDSQKKACDIDSDGIINAADASTVLAYYSYSQTGGESIFEAYLG